MKLPAFLEGVPRIAFVLVVPLVGFIVAVGISLGSGGSNNKTADAVAPTETPAVQTPTLAQAAPTATAGAPAPTATPDYRTDCNAIRGTSYKSDAERDWYQKNCNGAGGTTAAGNPGSITGAAPPVGGGQAPIGDRLVIPSIGVNADVWRASVDPSGQMPDPTGYFNVVWYDFSSLPGLGGYIGKGNAVLAGHVDCARCHDGASGLAVFYYTKNMRPGDTAQYYTADGKVYNFVVTLSADYTSASDWGAIVSAGAADLTLITCGGVFDPVAHEYNLRHVVALKIV